MENARAGSPGAEVGLVSNIQRFSIHFGPGLRTAVFLKGCPLRCDWCSHPEAMRAGREILVRDEKCVRCGSCVETCPRQAIRIGEEIRAIDWGSCDRCTLCADTCPSHAIEAIGAERNVAEIVETVERDAVYLQRTGGGLTVSGGEPLLQWRFAVRLLAAAKRRGWHTALDTTGYAEWEVLEETLDHTDLLLYDLKHLRSKPHRHATGVPNERILENLERVARETARKRTTLWVRHPLVAGFNDDEEDFESLCRFVSRLGSAVEKLSLLPYHDFAEARYKALGRAYPYEGMPAPSDERIERFERLAARHGIAVEVGR